MKSSIFLLLCTFALVSPLVAQSEANERKVSLDGIEHVSILVNYSSVYLKTGNTATLKSKHIVTVNGQDEPELRELDIRREGKTLYIEELKPNLKVLEKRFPDGIRSERGKVTFGDRSIRFESGKASTETLETRLVITVPENVTVEVETVYGSISAKAVNGLKRAYAEYGSLDIHLDQEQSGGLELESHYGKVDVSVPAQISADLKLRTEYGSLYTDLDIDVDTRASRQGDFLEEMVGQLGRGGAMISCNAPYGNVYLRKL